MTELRNILVVAQEKKEVSALLPKVKQLAAAHNSSVHVIRIAYEGFAELGATGAEGSAELKTYILRSEEKSLKADVASCGTLLNRIQTAALWGRRSWEAILDAAKATKTDLIVKSGGSAARANGSFRPLRTPDDWNLLREANVPVLLCGSKPWSSKPKLIAAVDVFDDPHTKLNKRILQQAQCTTAALHGELQVITAFPSLHPWTSGFATFRNYQKLILNIEREAKDKLRLLLDQHKLNGCLARALEGDAESVIQNVANADNTDFLVIGTSARAGLEAIVIGNTAEKILQRTDIDVLTVP